MKKITILKTFVLALILLAGTGSAWAETVTYTISAKNTLTTSGTAPSGSSATLVETFSTSKQMTSGQSQTVTLSGYFGYKITSITLSMRSNTSTGSGNFIYKIDNGADNTIIATNPFNNAAWNGAWSTTYTNVTKSVNIVCGTTSTVLKIAATANSLYCESYSLTYESVNANPTVATPTFSVDAGTHTYPQSVTIETLTDNADIYYTLDGTTPTASSTLYEGAISLPLGTTTLKAIGIKTDFDNSTVAEAEYIISLAAPVATEATNAWKNRFFANWETVDGATQYIVSVLKKTGFQFSEDFSGFTAGQPNGSPDGNNVASSLDTYTQNLGWTGIAVYQAGGTAKMGGSSSLGSIVTPVMNLSGYEGNFTVSFDAMAWSGDATELKIYLDDNLVHTVTDLNNSADYTMKSYSINLSNGTATSKLKFEGKQASKARFFLDNVLIKQGVDEHVTGSPFTVNGGSTNTYEVTGLTQMVQYYYTVKAKNGAFESAASNEVSAMIDMGTGVNNATALSGIAIHNGNLMVPATAGTLIEVYNIAGQKIVSQTANEGVNTIAIAQRGAMIVKIGTETVKVVI